MAPDQCPQCVALREEVEDLRRALAVRDLISQAKGLLMAADGCDAEEAFGQLLARAQDEDRTVLAVAEQLVAANGIHPTAPTVGSPTLRLVRDR